MSLRPTWWSGSVVFLACIILAAVATSAVIRTPNATGGGAMVMCIIIAVAVILKATFQHLMSRRQKKLDAKLKRDENHVA